MASTETSFPFSGQTNSESDWAKLIGTLAETGVIDGLTLSAGSGMQVIAALGKALVRGFYYELSGDPKPLAIGASHATLTRRDYLILKLDLAADSITLLVKAGTPSGSTGTLPALTQNATVWEHPVGIITIPGGASNIVSGNIAQLAAGIGLRVIPYAGTGQRPTPATLALGVNTTDRTLELFTGGSWYSLNPEVTWETITGKPATFAPTAHLHAQSDITGLATALAGKAAAAHDHDDRYYLKSAVDSALAGKSDTSHTHAWTAITGKPTTFAPSAHDHAQLSFGGGILFAWDSTRWWSAQMISGGNIQSQGAWGYDVGGVTRKAVWMDSTGILGFASSSRKRKQDITPTTGDDVPEGAFEFTLEQLDLVRAVTFRYRAAVAKAKKDPTIRAQREIGMIAEELHDAGLWPFVMYERDEDDVPQPVGLHYEMLGVAAIAWEQLILAELRAERLAREELAADVAELRALIEGKSKG